MNTHPLLAGSCYARLLAVALRALASFSVLLSSLTPLVPVSVAQAAEVDREAATMPGTAAQPDGLTADSAMGEPGAWELAGEPVSDGGRASEDGEAGLGGTKPSGSGAAQALSARSVRLESLEDVTVMPDWFAVSVAGGAYASLQQASDDSNHTIYEENVRVSEPGEVNNCDVVTYTLVATNTGAVIDSVVITSSMPSGFEPAEPQRVFSDSVEANETITAAAVFTATCVAVSGQNVFTLTQTGQDPIVVRTDFAVNPGALTVRKEPAVIEAELDDVVTWTVFVENTGYGVVSNVLITDDLGSGLTYSSGLTNATVPTLGVGGVVSYPVVAEVVGCSGLANVVTATWGCEGEQCLEPERAKGAVDLQMTNPDLVYTPTAMEIPYCDGSAVFTIPFENLGDGTAVSGTLDMELSGTPLTVTVASANASYTGGAFLLPEIRAGESYDLVFTLTIASPEGCLTSLGGSFALDLAYEDRCGNLYATLPKSRGWSLVDTPGALSVSKNMPFEVYRGEEVTATIDVDLTGITSTVLVTDAVPAGWGVVDADNGVTFTIGNQTYITWSLMASDTLQVVLSTPDAGTGCQYCGMVSTNVVTATGSDCRECVQTVSAEATTQLQCDEPVATSKKDVSGAVPPCTDPAYTYTNTYRISETLTVTPSWDSIVFTESLLYQSYVTNSAAVGVSEDATECTALFSATVSGGQLVIDSISPTCGITVPGSAITITYQTSISEPFPCSGGSFYDWSYLDLGVTGNAECAVDGILEEGVPVVTTAPEMALNLVGLDDTVSACGEYTVTLEAERTSDAPAYDAVIDLITDTYAVLDVVAIEGVQPVLTETNAAGYHWYYGDGFTENTTSTVQVRIQLRCATDNVPFSATLSYDNECNDGADGEVASYGGGCSTGGVLADPLYVPCRPIVTKFPELLWAEGDIVTWTLTVYNSGAGPAYEVTLTDTLGADLVYVFSSITSTEGSVAGVEPITSSNVVTWIVPLIEPKEKVTAKLVAEIVGCADLNNQFAGQQGCLEDVCIEGCADASVAELPDTLLVNTNAFVSPVETCYTTTVTATVRNAGLMSVYSATVTQTLPTGVQYVDGSASYTISTGTTPPMGEWDAALDPVSTTTASGSILTWGPDQIEELVRIHPETDNTVWVRFDAYVNCSFRSGRLSVQAGYQDVCDVPFETLASNYVLESEPPDVSLLKVGRNLSTTLEWSELTYAEPGELVQWGITLTNSSDTPAYETVVTDVLPSNMSYVSASPPPSGTTGPLTWTVGTLAQGSPFTALITATVNDNGCTVENVQNTVTATWGCPETPCREEPITDLSGLRTRPLYDETKIEVTPDLDQCEGTVAITLENEGPPAYTVTLTNTLTGGFVYHSGLAASSTPTGTPVLGDDSPHVFTWTVLPTGITTLTFRVRNGGGAECDAPEAVTDTVSLEYDDACTGTLSYTSTQSAANVDVGNPVLVVEKEPFKQFAQIEDTITWTLAVTNTGDGLAPGVLVTDVVGSGYSGVTATVGTYPDDTNAPTVSGNVITWTPAITLAPGALWTATVEATVEATGTNTNTVEVVGTCGAGCVYATESYTAFGTLLSTFGKEPEVQTGTIGSEVVFTLTATTGDEDALYRNLVITDTLPDGLGYITSTLIYTQDLDSSSGGPELVTATPAVSPTHAESGAIVWELGDVSGTAAITAVVTAVIQNNIVNQQGVRQMNAVSMTYTFDEQDYVLTDTTSVDVVEPTLIIAKSVEPAAASPGDTVLFDIELYHAPTSTVPAYDVLITDVVPIGLAYLSNSWDQIAGPSADVLEDSGDPVLTGGWTVIPTTTLQANPIRLRFDAVVSTEAPLGAIYTNTVTTTWTSLLTDTYGEERDGRDGVGGALNDYARVDDASVGLYDVGMDKTGSLTVVAGTMITYGIEVENVGPGTATEAVVTDTMPFQVSSVTATFSVPGGIVDGTCMVTEDVAGDVVVCEIGDIPSGATASILLTATVDADTPEGADLRNVAELTVTSPDGETVNNTDSTDTEVLTEADVGVTKSGPGTVTAGEEVTYTIVVSNSGPSAAEDVDVKDLLPEGVTYVAGSTTQVDCVSGICQLGEVAVGETITIVITGTVGSDVTGTITNTAQVFADTFDPESDNDRRTAPSDVNTDASLQIAKTDLTDPVYAGDTYFYEVVITNTGPSDAQDVVITDALPSQVTFEGASPGCAHDGESPNGLVTCVIGMLAAGESRDFLINTRVLSDTTDGVTGTNYVTATTTTTGTIFSDSEPTTYLQKFGNQTDLALTKWVTPATAVAGSGRFTYTLVITNNGEAPASGVQVVDAYPREFEFVSATASDDSTCNSGVTCDLGEMAVDDVVTVTVVVDVPSDVVSGTYTNTASVGSAAPDSAPGNNTFSVPAKVVEEANLQIRKVANPETATPGEDLTYTILVTNTGWSDADNVTISDTLPSGFSLALVTSSQGGCASLPCNLGTIVAGGYADITVNGVVSPSASGSLVNTAVVTSSTTDTEAQDTITTTLTAGADLALTKDATATVNAGERITYTLTVYNLGPSDAENVVVTDTLPVSVTDVSASEGCGASGGVVTCTQASLAAGSSAVFTISVTVDPDVKLGTNLRNSAVVGSDVADPNDANDEDETLTGVVSEADLTIAKSGEPATVVAGELVTYTVMVTNTGPSAAQSVDIKDTLPDGVEQVGNATIERSMSSDPAACDGAICEAGTVPLGEVLTMTVVGRVDPSVESGSTLTDTATVFSPSDDNAANNQATASTDVERSSDLTIEKSATPSPASAGDALTYEIVVTNLGPSDADGVTVSDTLPSGFITETVSSSQGGCTSLPCVLGTIPAGDSASVSIAGTVSSTLTSNLVNTAGVTAATQLTSTEDDTKTITTTLSTLADLVLTKDDSDDPVQAGERLTYMLTVENRGGAAAQNVVVTDTLPSGTTVVTGTVCSETLSGSGVVVCTAAQNPLPAGGSETFTIVVDVDPSVVPGYSLVNEAVAASDTPDSDPDNNLAVEDTEVLATANLELSKSSEPSDVSAGERLTYTILVTNTGPADATDVRVLDSIPDGESLVSATASNNGVCNSGVLCLLGTLEVDEVATVTIVVDLEADLAEGTVIENQASAFAEQLDPPEPVQASDVLTVARRVDLKVEKQDAPDPVAPGQLLRYELLVSNAGPSDAANVVVTDTLSVSVTFQSASLGCSHDGTDPGGVVTCTIASLAAGADRSFEITVEPLPTLADNTIVTNTAEVGSDTTELADNLADNTDSVTSTVLTGADVGVLKTGPDFALAGERVTFSIEIENFGPAGATGVSMTDTLPLNVLTSTASFSSSQGSCTQTGRQIACDIGDMGVGAVETVTVTVQIKSDAPLGSSLRNRAVVDSTSRDFNGLNDESVHFVEVVSETDLGIAKTGPFTATAGLDVITYTLVISNNGPSAAADIFVEDQLPEGLTFLAAQSTKGGCSAGVLCTIGTLSVSDIVTVTVTAAVDADVPGGTVLTNTARVFGSIVDTNSNNDVASIGTTVESPATLTIGKLDLFDPVEPGWPTFYEIVVTNEGPAVAYGVLMTDTLPVSATFEAASADCTHDGSPTGGVVTCTLAQLDVGDRAAFDITVFAPQDVVSGTTLYNEAAAVASNAGLVTDAVTTTIQQGFGPPTDLEISKSGDLTAAAGGQVTYTVVVTNHGPAIATDVEVKDILPDGVTLASASDVESSQGLCFPSTFGALCQLGRLEVGGVATVTLVADVGSGVTAGDRVTNTAQVFADNPDTNTEDNEAQAGTAIEGSADLRVTKAADPDPVTPGGTLSYEIVVENLGPSDDAGVTITDTLPAGLTFSGGSGDCAPTNGDVLCGPRDIAAGDEIVFTVIVDVASSLTGTFTNTVVVDSETVDPDTTNNEAEEAVDAAPWADLELDKSALATVSAGEAVTYTLTVYNHGPSDAENVVVTDTLPPGVELDGASPQCGDASGVVTCTVGTLAVGSSEEFTISVVTDDDIQAETSLENVAEVGSDTPDSDLWNNRDDADTSIIGEADLSLSKSGPMTVTAGAPVKYTVILTNTGPSTARDVDVKDLLPSGVTYVGGVSERGTCVAGICQIGDVAAGESVMLVINGTVGSDLTAGATITNTAEVYADTSDPNAENDSDTVMSTVETEAGLRVNKVGLRDPVGPTEGFLYQIVVTNDGPSDAQDVVVTDRLDANVTFAGASEGCTHDGSAEDGDVTCAVGTLGAGVSRSFFMGVTAGDVVSGTLLTNVVTATSPTAGADVTDTVTTTVQTPLGPTADVGITKSGTPDTVVAGERVTYTLTITNSGPSAATNVRVLELVPAGTTVITMTGENPDDEAAYCSQGGSCYLGTVKVGLTATITVVLKVDPDFAGFSLLNTASVSADQADTDPSDNFADVSTGVTQSADLSLEKVDMPDPVLAGEVLLYQLTVSNAGSSAAMGVVVTDTLPVSTTFAGASPECVETGGLVTCGVGTVNAGQSVSLWISMRVDEDLPDPTDITNRATVGAETADPNDADNTVTVETTVEQPSLGPADLSIAKRADPDPVVAGELLTYTLVVTNAGPAVAQNVRVLDALPSGVTFVSAQASQGLCSGAICELDNLGIGATATITIVVRVHSDQVLPLSNYTRVAASNPDPDDENNQVAVVTEVEAQANVTVKKVADPDPATPGEILTYEIVVENMGPSDAQGVKVYDNFPEALEGVTASSSRGTCIILPGDQVRCDVGTMATGEAVVIVVVGTVASDQEEPIVNLAWVESETSDFDSDTITTTLAPRADLALRKDATPTVSAGERITYTLTVYNRGPSDAQGVVVTDTLPPGVTFEWSTESCTDEDGVLTCSLATVPAGTEAVLTIVVVTDARIQLGTSLENMAEVVSEPPDPDLWNNRDDADTSIIGQADLSLTKTGPVTATAGEAITYTVVITNSGPSTAQSVDVKDVLPEGVEWVSGSADQGVCVSGICQLGDVAAEDVVTIVITGHVGSGVTGTVVNEVDAFSDTPDPDAEDRHSEVTTTIQSRADLWVGKKAMRDPATPGEALSYEVTVRNEGPSDAVGVMITDTLPDGLTFSGGSLDCTPVGDEVVCGPRELGAGDEAVFIVIVDVASDLTETFTNTVVLGSETVDPDTTNNEAEEAVDVAPWADLELDKSALATASVSWALTYTLEVHNHGPSDAQGVVVTDTLPEGVTYTSSTTGCAESGGLVVCGPITLEASSKAVYTIAVTVDNDVPFGTSLENDAEVESETPDPNRFNNKDDADTSIVGYAELSVAKSGTPTVTAGSEMTYTIVVTNSGPVTAEAVQVVDALPRSVSLLDVQPSQGVCNAGVTCDLGDLGVGMTATVTMVALVDSDVTDTFTNVVRVSAANPESNTNNNEASAATEAVLTWADFSVDKTAEQHSATPGGTVSYEIVVVNAGPSDALDVVVTDTLPEGVTFVGAAPPATSGPEPLVWELGDLAAGEDMAIDVIVEVSSGLTDTFTNTVTVTSTTTPDPVPENNTDDEPLDVAPSADLELVKDAADTVSAGEVITYTLTVYNRGLSDARDVVVTDTLPAGLVPVSLPSGCTETMTTTVVCGPFDLEAQMEATYTFGAQVTGDFEHGESVENVAVVASRTTDEVLINNRDTADTTVVSYADLRLTKTGPVTVSAGSPVTYVIEVTNLGPAVARNVNLQDVLPTGVTLDSITIERSGSGPMDCTGATCELGDVEVGEMITVEVVAIVDIYLGETTMTNLATVSADSPDPNPRNNRDTAETEVMPSLPHLAIEKWLIGQDTDMTYPNFVTFSIEIENVGPTTVTILPLFDEYDPYYLSFVDADPYPQQDADDGLLSWSDLTGPAPHGVGSDLAPGEMIEVTVVFSIANNIETSTTNLAYTFGARDDERNSAPRVEDDEPVVSIPTAVEVLDFLARNEVGRSVQLSWDTGIEIAVLTFRLYRAADLNGPRTLVAEEPARNEPGSSYGTEDTVPSDGFWYYWLKAVTTSGEEKPLRGPVMVGVGTSKAYLPCILK